jgi:O-antigen/teichoic acid export membrane protein
MIVFGIGILLTTFGSEWFFQATEQYFYITVRSIIFKIIALIGLFFLVREDSDYVLYGAFIVFAASASNLLNIFRLIRSIDWSFSVKLKPLRHMKPILIFFGNTFANNLYLTLDTVLLGFLSPSTFQLGLYQLVVRLKNVILSGVGSISNAVLPRLSYQAREHRELFNRLLRKSSSFTIILSSTISIYIFIMANDIILLLSGTRFVGAVPSLQVMSIVILFAAISGITGYQILTPLGKEKIMTISTLLGGVLDLVLNVLLDANFGAFGASLSLLATEGLISLIQVIACRKYILSILERNQVLAILMNIIISTCLLAFLHRFILSFSPLINLVISGICLLLSESIVLYVLKEQLTSNIIHQVLNRSLYNKNEHGLR